MNHIRENRTHGNRLVVSQKEGYEKVTGIRMYASVPYRTLRMPLCKVLSRAPATSKFE